MRGWESRIEFGGEVDLGGICVAVEMNAVPMQDITNGKAICGEKEGAQDQNLGHAELFQNGHWKQKGNVVL